VHLGDTEEECGTLASRQRWHFALAVATGKPALAGYQCQQALRNMPFSLC